MKIKVLCGILLCSIGLCCLQAETLSDLEHIELDVYGAGNGTPIQSNDFYAVYMDSTGLPYVNVGDFFKTFLDYQVTPKGRDLVIQSVPDQGRIVIDMDTGAFTSTIGSKASVTLPKDSFQVIKGELWVNTQALQMIVGGGVKWTQSNYSLLVNTNLPALAILQGEHANTVENAEAMQVQDAIAATQENVLTGNLPTLYPHQELNTEVRYQLGTTQTMGQGAGNVRNAGFNTITDLLTGTFTTSGSYTWPGTGSAPISWNYTLQKEPYFSNLQLGYISSNATLFSNNTSLKNGITVSRLQQSNPSLNFYYAGQTLPGTEIDVWRNGGYLLQTLTVGQNGQYTIQDTNAAPGNTYEIDYYYSNGTSTKTLVRYTPGQDLLLRPLQWDVNATTGQMLNGTDTIGQYTQTEFRTGVFSNLTAGVGLYNVPTNAESNINIPNYTSPYNTSYYLDTYWQILPSLGLQYNQIMQNGGGYALQATSTYFNNQSIQVYYKNLPPTSPFINLITSSIQYQASRFFLAQDNLSLPKGFNLQTEYQVSNLQNEITTQLSGYINNYLVPNVQAGWTQVPGQAYQPTLTLGNTFNFSAKQSLQYTNTWTRGIPSTNSFTYVYRPLNNLYSLSGGYQFGGGTGSTYTLNATWNITPDWALQASASRNVYSIGISYVGAASLNGLMQNQNNFGMGTVEGTLMSPAAPGSPSEPQAGVTVSAGGASAVTNENGYYKIEGIPVNQLNFLNVDASTISGNFAPKYDQIPVFLRPGTIIHYNPPLTTTIGVDGAINVDDAINSVHNNMKITQGSYILAESEDGSLKRIGLIDPTTDTFVVNNLNPGTYKLMLEGVKNPPRPVVVVIKPTDTWISGVNINW